MSYVFTTEQQQELSALIRNKGSRFIFSRNAIEESVICCPPLPDKNLSVAAYAEYICSAAPADEEVIIRNSLARNQLTGDSRFIYEIERIAGKG